MASASPRLPQALTPPPLGDLGAHGDQRVYWVLASPPIRRYLSCCLDRYRVRNHRECCICACIWAWEYRIPRPIFCTRHLTRGEALYSPETKKPRKNNWFLRGFFVHSHTRNQAYFMNHRPSRQNTESSADFQGFNPRKRLLSPPKKCIFVTVTKVVN